MKRAVVIANERAEHQKSWGGAFAEGLRRHGWRVSAAVGFEPADLVVMWGVRKRHDIAAAKAAGADVVVLERGYLGDRMSWTSVSFGGGLNGRGEFRGARTDPERFETHFGGLMRPWREDRGGYALLIGQVPGDMSLAEVDIDQWYRIAAKALRRQGWEVMFRPHPLAGRRAAPRYSHGVKHVGGTLHEAMDRAGLVVTWNSNAGVDAALYGRPVVAMDPGSMAWDVAGHQVTETETPDRADWAARLAWKQFSRAEIASGECWEAVGCQDLAA